MYGLETENQAEKEQKKITKIQRKNGGGNGDGSGIDNGKGLSFNGKELDEFGHFEDKDYFFNMSKAEKKNHQVDRKW